MWEFMAMLGMRPIASRVPNKKSKEDNFEEYWTEVSGNQIKNKKVDVGVERK